MTVRKLFNFWFGKKREGFYLFLAIVTIALYLTGTGFAYYGYPDTARVLQAAAFAGAVLAALLFLIHWNLFASHQFSTCSGIWDTCRKNRSNTSIPSA